MKLRMQKNHLRLRLSQGEVATLERTGAVAEAITFGPGAALRYSLEVSDACTGGKATLEGTSITIVLPREQAEVWLHTDEEGIRVDQAVGGGAVLTIQVEKDYACLHRPATAGEADAFPHPARTGAA